MIYNGLSTRATMLINEMPEQECRSSLAQATFGRLGCALDDQPYVVPVYFAYDKGYVYVLGTAGQKIEWMRRNPKVCLLVDEAASETKWTSVIALGRYQELREPQFTEERALARRLLKQRPRWWQTPLAERELKSNDELIEPILRSNQLAGCARRAKAFPNDLNFGQRQKRLAFEAHDALIGPNQRHLCQVDK